MDGRWSTMVHLLLVSKEFSHLPATIHSLRIYVVPVSTESVETNWLDSGLETKKKHGTNPSEGHWQIAMPNSSSTPTGSFWIPARWYLGEESGICTKTISGSMIHWLQPGDLYISYCMIVHSTQNRTATQVFEPSSWPRVEAFSRWCCCPQQSKASWLEGTKQLAYSTTNAKLPSSFSVVPKLPSGNCWHYLTLLTLLWTIIILI